MPSNSFWEPAEQFRAPRTANVLNSSLGALSDIDNVLNENDRQNQRERRPMFHVDPEDMPPETEIDHILDMATGTSVASTRFRDLEHGETRPAPRVSSNYTSFSPYARIAKDRGYLYGSPEYDELLDLQNEANKSGKYFPSNTPAVGPLLWVNDIVQRDDLFQIKDDRVGDGAGHRSQAGSAQTTSDAQPRRPRAPRGSGFPRAIIGGRSGARPNIEQFLERGSSFVAGSRSQRTLDFGEHHGRYAGTFGVFTGQQASNMGLGLGELRRLSNRQPDSSTERDMSEGLSGLQRAAQRVAYSYTTPIAFHLAEGAADEMFGQGGRLSAFHGSFEHIPTGEGDPVGRGTWVIPNISYSRSTTAHQRTLRSALQNMSRRYSDVRTGEGEQV